MTDGSAGVVVRATRDGRPVRVMRQAAPGFFVGASLTFTADGRLLAAGGQRLDDQGGVGAAMLWEIESGRIVQAWTTSGEVGA